jgi:Tfp pilus assembly protein PilV
MRTIDRALGRFGPGRLPQAPATPRNDEGFGLLECIIAMVALMVVLIPTGYLFTNVLSQAASARQRITALSVAEQWIETLNTEGPPADTNNQPEVGTSISEPSSVLSGITYKVSALFNWTDATGGSPDFCNTDTSPVLGLQVSVSWVDGQSITDQAILNFPASGTLTDGYLAIQVNGDPAGSPPNDVGNNSWSKRVETVPVQVSGSTLASPYSLTSASDGCTFLQLVPGTYTVQVGPDTGFLPYVANYNEASSETQALSNQSPITVTDAEITQVTFQFDEGANVGLKYPTTTMTDDGIACPDTGGLICLAMGQSAPSASAPSTSPMASGTVKTSSGWSVAAFPSTMTRIEDLGCTASACIAVGYNSSGGAAAVSINGTTWTNSTLPAGVSQLTNIVCPAAATTPACLAIGSGTSSNGVLLSATISGSTVTWTKDTTPTVTALTQIVCPSATAQPICFVLGTTSSSVATIISNTGSGSGTTWTPFSSSATWSALTQITCNSTTFCMAIGKVGATAEITAISQITGTTVTWTAWTNSTGTTPTSFSSVACTPTGDDCWATGATSTASIIDYCNTTTGTLCSSTTGSTFKADTGIPSAATSVNSITCEGTSTAPACFALYSTSTSAGVLSITTGTAWSTPTLPSGAVSFTQLVCPSTTACYAVGTNSTSAIVDVLASGTWTSATFTGTTGGNPVYISQLLCYAATSCEAAGATETSAEVFDYSSSGVTFSASGTPSQLLPATTTLSGLFLDNPPIMVSDSNLQPNTTIEMSAPTTANGPQTEVGPLFPFASGYSIALGYCATELTTASVSASSVPGATLTSTPSAQTVNLPMGILPIEATSSTGAVLSGATISIVDASCTTELTPLSSGSYPALSNPPSNPSNPTSYSMPTTGVDGLSRIAVIYGTYQVTVTSGGTHATTTITVNPTSIVVGSTTYYMPAFVPIPD